MVTYTYKSETPIFTICNRKNTDSGYQFINYVFNGTWAGCVAVVANRFSFS